MENVKERVKQAMNEWDYDRLKSELVMYIDQDSDEELERMFFDDIATEREYAVRVK